MEQWEKFISGADRRRCYLFILRSEARPVHLVEGHHDGHHVFAVHDGDGEDALSLILCQLVHEAAEVRTLMKRKQKWYLVAVNYLIFALAPTSTRNPGRTHTYSIRTRRKQRLSIIYKLNALVAALQLLLLLCGRGHQLCSAGEGGWRKSSSLTAKKEQSSAQGNPQVTESWFG